MSLLVRPKAAAAVARVMQRAASLGLRLQARSASGFASRERFPEFPRHTRRLTIATSVAPAEVTVYLPTTVSTSPPVYVNFHGGGYILPLVELDDPLCRFLAAEAGVVVLNVDYAVAPQHRFPGPPHQAYEVLCWVAEHGSEQGWDANRLVVGGQSAGGGLAAAVARQALGVGKPRIALQVLHYAPLDLATDARDKHSVIDNPKIKPWMSHIFDSSYVPDSRQRSDPLVSPAGVTDTADLTGIAPALILTAEYDLLREEGIRYAQRLDLAGSLVEHYDIGGVDHGYDMGDAETARAVYTRIARAVRSMTALGG